MSNTEFWTFILINISIILLLIRITLLEKDLFKLEAKFESHLISHFIKEYTDDRNAD